MIVYYGTRIYGKIDKCGTTYIGTLFAHIYWMPLIPLGSKLVLQENGDGTYRFIPNGFNWRSTIAAYLRTWGVLGAVAAVFAAIPSAMQQFDQDADVLSLVLVYAGVAALLAATIGAWVWLGKLNADERAQRLAYQDFVGHPIDVALMGEGRERIRASLFDHVVDRARGLIAGGYRTTVDPMTHWGTIALDPTVSDSTFLRAALTLSRLEWSYATGAAKTQLATAHNLIWAKLRAADPTLLTDAAAIKSF